MKGAGAMARRLSIFAVLILVVSAGCLPATRPPERVNEYLIHYDLPKPPAHAEGPLLVSVRVDRFTTAAPYADPAIVVRTGAFEFYSSPLERWRVAPGEMLGELIARDMRDCGLFIAVFSEYDLSEARINLDGLVEELCELRDGGSRRALLKVRLTLSDTDADEGFKVMFQKPYTQTEPIEKPGALGLVEAMSRAARAFSLEVLQDIKIRLKGFKE